MFMAFVDSPCPGIYIPTNVQMYIQAFVQYLLKLIFKSELATNEITSPRTKKNLAAPEDWTPLMKIIPQYILFVVYIHKGSG